MSGEATNIAGALRQVEANPPDVAVVDISLDGDNGIELVEEIKAKWPAVKILVSSVHDEKVFAGRALRAGAMGYICKREDLGKIVAAIHQILPARLSQPRHDHPPLRRAAVGQSLDRDPVETLSNRELQVFEMIGQGMTTVQIAAELDVSPKTIESHRKQIKAKMNLLNRRSRPAPPSSGSKRAAERPAPLNEIARFREEKSGLLVDRSPLPLRERVRVRGKNCSWICDPKATPHPRPSPASSDFQGAVHLPDSWVPPHFSRATSAHHPSNGLIKCGVIQTPNPAMVPNVAAFMELVRRMCRHI